MSILILSRDVYQSGKVIYFNDRFLFFFIVGYNNKLKPNFKDYPVEILSTLEATNVFEGIKKTSCEKSTITSNQDGQCQVENVDAVVSLLLDPKIQQENCQKKCGMRLKN